MEETWASGVLKAPQVILLYSHVCKALVYRGLEEGMATHSSLLAWRIPMDRGAWQARVYEVPRVRHDLETKLEHERA